MSSRGAPVGLSTWNRLFEDARREGIRIYTLDPAGLIAPELGFEGAYEDQTPAFRAGLDASRRSGQRFLQIAASNTGGLAFVNRWDLTASVEELATDTSSYYVLGYTPVPADTGQPVRSVQVRMARSGLTAYSRSRYLAPGTGSWLQVLTRVAGAGASEVTVEALLVGPGGERRVRLTQTPGFTADDVGAALPLAGLAPGPYVLTVVAESPTDERQVQSIRIDIGR
jgi:hypothetical protein